MLHNKVEHSVINMLAKRNRHLTPSRPQRGADRGAAIIEFVLLLGLLFLLVSAIVDLAVLMRKSYTLSEAARHGSRSAGALWSGTATCPAPSPVSLSCDSVNSIPDTIVRNIGRATCTYIQLAGLHPSDWIFSFSLSDGRWSNLNGTNAPNAVISKVSLAQGSNKQCLFCWQTFIGEMLMYAESEFPLENPECLLIT